MNKIFNTARSTLTIAMLAGLVWVLASAKTARADVMGQVWEGVPDAGNAADLHLCLPSTFPEPEKCVFVYRVRSWWLGKPVREWRRLTV
jgi:hypothetical protein